jgi:hypothetical protein
MATVSFKLAQFVANGGQAPEPRTFIDAVSAAGLRARVLGVTVNQQETRDHPSAVVIDLEGSLSADDRTLLENLVASYRNPSALDVAKSRVRNRVRLEFERMRDVRRLVALSDAQFNQEEQAVELAIDAATSETELAEIGTGLRG